MKETPYPANPILLVDDELPWLRSLSLTLRESTGISNIVKCSDSREVINILRNKEISLVLLDLTMPHLSGQELLPMITEEFPEIPIIVLSGLNQIDTAVRCMQLGAFDYFVKTVEKDRLITSIQRAYSMQEMRKENLSLKARFLEGNLEYPEAFARINTCSKKMRAVLQYCEAVAQSSEPILITGESGVGKELIARAISRISCPAGPWVAVNVAGLEDTVFSDTLFGHTKGAFTGAERERRGLIEEAGGGTLFLDEIGDLNQTSQIKLLRLLQEGEYFPLGADSPRKLKAKLIFATNNELACKTATGEFRKDLYYRLSAHHVRIPALRERTEDMPLLIAQFLKDAAVAFGKKTPTAPKELVSLLSLYSFPGNVRELRAMIFNAVSLHKSHVLSMESFKEKIGCSAKDEASVSSTAETFPESHEAVIQFAFPDRLPNLVEISNLVVNVAMQRAGGNQTLAATMLGISRQALAKRLKKLTV